VVNVASTLGKLGQLTSEDLKNKYRNFKDDYYLLLMQIKIANYVVIGLILLLYIFSENILKVWIKSPIEINHSIFNVLLLSSAVKSLSFTLINYLNAKNNQIQSNTFLFAFSIICLPIIYIITNKFNLYGFAIFLLIYDVFYFLINAYFIFIKNHNFLTGIVFEIFKIILLGFCFYFSTLFILTFFLLILVDYITFSKNSYE
jgi:O-antigen/teichoic acid export membrane protein